MNPGEYHHEPIRGLPGALPAGETLLWQGSPLWWPLARRALHVVPVAVYFTLLAAWACGRALLGAAPWLPSLRIGAVLLLLGALTSALLCALAWGSARATVYSLTSRRLVIRHGIALPMSLNLPLQLVQAMALSRHADGSGEIALALPRSSRVGYVLNWPHVRPWHFAQPQPTLRAIAHAERVAQLLARALAATNAVAGASPAAAAGSAASPASAAAVQSATQSAAA